MSFDVLRSLVQFLQQVGICADQDWLRAHAYDTSITELPQTLELAPTFRPAHYYLGLAYVQKGLAEKARGEFTAAGLSDNAVLILALSGHGKQALNQLSAVATASLSNISRPPERPCYWNCSACGS